VTPPTIHLNGTSPGELTHTLQAASDLLWATIKAVTDTAPNARDYYPQGPAAYGDALTEHIGRVQRLTDVRAELIELERLIDAQARTTTVARFTPREAK
jgi:hypothetical protein